MNVLSQANDDWIEIAMARRWQRLESGEILTPQRRRILILITLMWALLAVLYMLPNILRVQERLSVEMIVSHFLVAVLGALLSVFLLAAVAKARRIDIFHGFLLSAAAVFMVSAALSAIDLEVFEWIHSLFGFGFADDIPYSVKWTANFAIFSSQFSLIAVAFWTLETLEAHRKSEAELQHARLATAEAIGAANRAKLTALRFQLNPHFMFNTLNSISSLVVTRRNADAEEMLGQLSEFLRITLAGEGDAPQTLERELETVAAYLNIERIRFGQRLAIDVNCPPELREAETPSFLLQPLVENSIKYGVSNSEKTVTIRIEAMREADDLVLIVEDDGSCHVPSDNGQGIGLRNVRERLAALYGDAAHLEVIQRDRGFLSVIRMPFSTVEA